MVQGRPHLRQHQILQYIFFGPIRDQNSRPPSNHGSFPKSARLDESPANERLRLSMNALIRDLRYALRALAKNPGFSIAAILSLAIGIGANTSIFSITSALLLRPLPYKDASQLVILWNRSPGLGITQDWFSTAQYFDIKNGHSGFEDAAIAFGTNDNLTGNGDPQRIGTIRISSNLLPMLGYRAAMGRLFLPDEDLAGNNPTAILSYGTWTRRFG